MTEVREIKFDDIQQGDVVRTVRTFEDGFILSLEGEANKLTPNSGRDEYSWRDAHNNCVASNSFGKKADDKFYLVHREEKRDHLLISGNGDFQSFVLWAESDAKEMVERWNAEKRNGQVYRAVKVYL